MNIKKALKVYCFVGVRGIGKSTLIQAIMPRLPDVDHFTGSGVLRTVVGPDFANFDHYSDERKAYFREQAILYMKQHQEESKRDILVEGHLTLKNLNTDRIEGVFTRLDCEFYTDLILFQLPPQIIKQRREMDKGKPRGTDIDVIIEELDAEREEARRLSREWNIGLYYFPRDVVKTDQDKLVDELIGIIKGENHDN